MSYTEDLGRIGRGRDDPAGRRRFRRGTRRPIVDPDLNVRSTRSWWGAGRRARGRFALGQEVDEAAEVGKGGKTKNILLVVSLVGLAIAYYTRVGGAWDVKRHGRRRNPKRIAGGWMKCAVKKPGALRRTVKRRYGARGFTARGTIKRDVLNKLAREPGVTGKRARLAKTFRKRRSR